MNRRSNSTIGIVGVCCVAFLALAAAQSFGAVTNGFFDSSLSGWVSNDSSGVVWSSTGFYDETGNGTALLQQSGTLPSSILSQTFYVDPGSSSLSFQVRTPMPIIDETDHFYIQLLDSANQPLLGNPGNDYFFHWKSSNDLPSLETGWIASETPAGISIDEVFLTNENNGDWEYMLYSFEIPIETDWIGNDATLQFKLNHDYSDAHPTIILIDNAALQGGSTPPVVPIPSAMGLALSGLAAMGVFARKLA